MGDLTEVVPTVSGCATELASAQRKIKIMGKIATCIRRQLGAPEAEGAELQHRTGQGKSA